MNFWSRGVVIAVWVWFCHGEPPPVENTYRQHLLRRSPLSLVDEIIYKEGLHPESVPDEDVDDFEFQEDLRLKGISLSIGNEQYSLGWPPSQEFLEEFPFSEIFHFNPSTPHWSDASQRSVEDITNTDQDLPWPLILTGMGRYYLPDIFNSQVNGTCKRDLAIMYNPKNGSQSSNVTAMIDSWGKMPDGFIGGNFRSLGSFDECIRVLTPRNPPFEGSYFKGKYCTIRYTPGEESDKELMKELPLPVRVAPASALEPHLQLVVMYGTCMPSACTENDLMVSLNEHLAKMNTSTSVLCQTEDSPELEADAALIVMTILLSILGLLLLTSSILDIYLYHTGRDEIRKGPLKYLLVFSVYTNLEKMFQVNLTENKESITCIYGMRVLSMTWIVWGHQALLTYFISANLVLVPAGIDGHWMNQLILNAYPSVDTFFVMSGLLVAYGVIREKLKKGKINIIVFYLHRLLRLDVPIVLLCGFLAAYTKYLGHGPYASMIDETGGLQDTCRKYMWRDAVFLSNSRETNAHVSCLDVSWYTSVEFQIFLFTPIMMFPFLWGDLLKLDEHKRNKIGFIWLGILTLVSALIPGIITVVNKLPPGTVTGVPASIDYQNKVYMAPWCRASPYLVGLILGAIFRLDTKQRISIQKWQVVIGWLLAVTTGLAVVFGLYDYNKGVVLHEYNWAISFFYGGFNSMAWGIALAWVIFACKYGYGGPVNTFLSHPVWHPISRLTYCIFLVAIPTQTIVFTYNYQYPTYFSHLNKVVETVGALFIAGIGAIILSLVAEAPVIGLEKFLLGKGK